MDTRQRTQPYKGEHRYMSPRRSKNPSPKRLSETVEKIIVDLKTKGLSFNEIKDHLHLVHNYIISHRKIREILLKYGKKAKKLNAHYDSMVKGKIKIIEIDEIYQGREGMFMGIAEKYSTYLMGLEQLKGKSIGDFNQIMRPYNKIWDKIQIAVTDGLNAYIKSIPESFENVIQLQCHVHGYRDIMEEQDRYNRKARREYAKLKKSREKVKRIKRGLKHNEKQIILHEMERDRLICERNEFYDANGIIMYDRNQKHKKIRKEFKNMINFHANYVRSFMKMYKKWKLKLEIELQAINKYEREFQNAQTIALQTGRLVAEMKKLLDCHWADFNRREAKLQQRLANNRYPITKYLNKMLKNRKLLFADKTEEIQAQIPPNRANTNTIESIFGRYRLFFKKYRKMKDTPLSRAIFEILRLRHNLSGPYTGPKKNISPIKRLGIKSKYTNFLDCLC